MKRSAPPVPSKPSKTCNTNATDELQKALDTESVSKEVLLQCQNLTKLPLLYPTIGEILLFENMFWIEKYLLCIYLVSIGY